MLLHSYTVDLVLKKGVCEMAFGVSGPCFTCKYLNTRETSGGKVYCEWLKTYITPDSKGCGHHDSK